jgi:hypothetical protein
MKSAQMLAPSSVKQLDDCRDKEDYTPEQPRMSMQRHNLGAAVSPKEGR